MTNLVRQDSDEAGELARLGFDELGGLAQSIGTMERAIAARAFRHVPAGRPIQLVHDAISRGVSGGLGAAASAAGRGAQTLVERRPRGERPLSATPRGALGIAVVNGLVGDRLEREGSAAAPADGGARRRPAGGARAARARPGLPGRQPAARGLPARADGERARLAPRWPRALRRAPAPRRRPDARLRPLQQRPPHLGERPLAGRPARAPGRRVAGRGRGGRARRPLDGRARGPQRLPPRRARRRRLGRPGPARRLARLAAPGRTARAGGPLRRLRPQPAAGDADLRRLPASPQRGHPRPPRRLAGRRGLARAATPRRCAPPPARRCRCSRARRTASSRPP